MADDKLVYTYVPDLIRYYLSEEPLLDNVETYRLDDPDTLDWVLGSLDELVVKPVDGSGGKGIVIGPQATAAELGVLRERLRADPRGWIAQRPVALSTVADAHRRDRLAPRHIDLRPFAVNDGDDVWRAARRPDPGGAAGGRAGGQLQPGRRVEGHLGAGPAPVSGRGDGQGRARGRPPAAGRPARRRSRHRPAERTRPMSRAQ